jgi:hypothetical protein
MANPTLASAALAAVPRERSGMASGAVNTARQLGFAIGVAALGTVFTTAATSSLRTAGAHDPSGLASALSAGQAGKIAGAVPPQARAQLMSTLGSAYADGLREVFLACGIAGLLGGVLVLLLVRADPPGSGAPAQRPEHEAEPAGAH